MPIHWFDGHLDLACIALEGRDLTADLSDALGPPQPPTITLPALQHGRISGCLATVFTAPGHDEPCGYPSSDHLDEAHAAGIRQIDLYEQLERAGHLQIVRSATDLIFEPAQPLRIVMLMEGADPIRSPDDLPSWHERGLRAVGLSWARGTRYAGGNASPGPLTPLGIELVRALDDHGIIHDCSHLPHEAAAQLLDLANGPVMASHSNCRALIGSDNERHLPDHLIVEITKRGGIIGLNLFSQFLIPRGDKRRATVDQAIAHVEHICHLTGNTHHVGLGSDMDGGFGADRIPQGIDSPTDLTRLTDALIDHGWTDDQLNDFAFANWHRFLSAACGVAT